jgi:adenylate cyclase, class 2
MPVLFEFKARSNRNKELEKRLQQLDAEFVGEDHQIDTYFNVPVGRLKLREGIIENALIYYKRADTANAKQSDVLLHRSNPDKALKEVLRAALGIKTVVEKHRRIWFADNVKIHFDRLEGLGEFVEIEAIDNGSLSFKKLQEQCRQFANLFNIQEDDYVAGSYSDLLLSSPILTNEKVIASTNS